jgi:hypothetical protein
VSVVTPAQRVTLRLEIAHDTPPGAPIGGRLVITNAGNASLSLVSPHYNAALNIVVFDRYWNPVPPNSVGKAQSAYERIEAAPGQSYSFDLPDLVYTSGTARMRLTLGPGVYYVVAIYHPGTDMLPDRSSYPIAVASNVVELTVQ